MGRSRSRCRGRLATSPASCAAGVRFLDEEPSRSRGRVALGGHSDPAPRSEPDQLRHERVSRRYRSSPAGVLDELSPRSDSLGRLRPHTRSFWRSLPTTRLAQPIDPPVKGVPSAATPGLQSAPHRWLRTESRLRGPERAPALELSWSNRGAAEASSIGGGASITSKRRALVEGQITPESLGVAGPRPVSAQSLSAQGSRGSQPGADSSGRISGRLAVNKLEPQG